MQAKGDRLYLHMPSRSGAPEKLQTGPGPLELPNLRDWLGTSVPGFRAVPVDISQNRATISSTEYLLRVPMQHVLRCQ